ncbi:peptidase M24, structural domain-containing protein [Cladochytrium replicatum]|nr:peptidase M24, structural domain-containing protein [Cladochytrium replicatum]
MSPPAAESSAPHGTSKVSTAAKLAKLRSVMERVGVHAYIVPSEDAHQSEYIAPCDMRRAYISNFNGSAGLAVITGGAAALWTDGRYFLQASNQLDSNWLLMKSGLPDVPTKEEWLNKVLSPASTVGIDPTLITVSAARALSDSLNAGGHKFLTLPNNLIDEVWAEERPAMPCNPVAILPDSYAGKSVGEKIKELKEKIEKKNTWGFVITALDDIAWLFNLRGSDIAFNPVFFAYAIVTAGSDAGTPAATLFLDVNKLSEEVLAHLKCYNVELLPYGDIFAHVTKLSEANPGKKVWIDTRCSLALQESIGDSSRYEEGRSPIMSAKAVKNPAEVEGFRRCHIRDAAALSNFFAWMEEELVNKKRADISECDAADVAFRFRSEQADFVGLSFDTISSTGPNGAIIHYSPKPESCAIIRADQMYLIDSGGQYKDGTTDVTRTYHFGTPRDEERDAFTRVLKGHIAIDMVVFPKGTTGYLLDPFARHALWSAGLDYLHGTGHGVGHYLNVHEGPQGIGTRIAFNDTPLEPGMVISNEPGYYKDGGFGIRIENVVVVKPVTTANNFAGKQFYGFEHFTLVPIQTKLIKKELMTDAEVAWVNRYHAECWEKVSKLLTPSSPGYIWLQRETQPL